MNTSQSATPPGEGDRLQAEGGRWDPCPRVLDGVEPFGGERGPLNPDTITQWFDRTVRRSGLPRIRLHDLRHTHAPHLLAAGVGIKIVSERLGHASVAFTLDVYGHVMPGQQASAAAAAAALVD